MENSPTVTFFFSSLHKYWSGGLGPLPRGAPPLATALLKSNLPFYFLAP